MTPATIDAHLRARIDTFVGQRTDLVRRVALDAVHDALGTSATVAVVSSATPTATAAPKTRRGKRGKRTPEAVLEEAASVLACIKANEGQRLEQIGKGLGAPTKGLKLPIEKLFEQ